MTDAEKHSACTTVHQAWAGDDVKRPESGPDSGVRMDAGSKWSRRNCDVSDESDKGCSGRKTPSVSNTGSWRRGMTTQVGVTSPRTKSTSSTGSTVSVGLKSHGSGNSDIVMVIDSFVNFSNEPVIILDVAFFSYLNILVFFLLQDNVG